MHPFIELLSERRTACLWAGLAFSGFGSELNRMAVLWLAIEVAGSSASLLPLAQHAVVLVVSLGAGLFAHRLSPRATMIGTDLVSALVAVLPVVLAGIYGLTLWSLVASAMALAALSALFQPALLSSIPHVAGTKERVQGVNALLDATTRLSRLTGPFAAGLLAAVLPVLHFLTVNAVSFLASAWAVAAMGKLGKLGERPAAPAPPVPVSRRLMQGATLMVRHKDIRLLLLANTAVLAAWTIGVSLGLPFLVAQTGLSGLGLSGLGAVAALVAAYGAGDFLSNFWVAAHRPARLGRFMFNGYVVLGGALALVPLPFWLLPQAAWLPSMMAAAFVSGLGGPMFFIPMMTFLQTRLEGAELTSIIRLRLALTAAAMMAGAGLGSLLFGGLGAAVTVVMAGGLIALVGAWGSLWHPDIGNS
ncbi:hypothetical protein A3K87_19310 [Variovorax paradoxus]|uniref:MFS transporter n=1 Tax=Variovorax paradoxus TaxID=34073 RepID=A0AA91DMD1_VARPD|nr:MFS transporter [Variovorax paradoxus]OAK62039.1 hypothetical protein A3K87_19310 [Variovorax paradoxus]